MRPLAAFAENGHKWPATARELTPLAAHFIDVKNGIDDFPHRMAADGPARIGLGCELLSVPLGVVEVGRIIHAAK